MPVRALAMLQTPWPWALTVKTASSLGPLASKLPTTGRLELGVPMENVEAPWTA